MFTKFTLKESTFINITILYIDQRSKYLGTDSRYHVLIIIRELSVRLSLDFNALSQTTNYFPSFCYVLTMFVFLHACGIFFDTCCVIKRFVTSEGKTAITKRHAM